ncbi:MAG TPA: carboxypeptidase-like regulatory domain-containing protein [Pyrinomonadaceae bacterium]|nr:carboxypeptidase-like regulatory domain-containing protein [Pyrinomonadaceae bacterium]
MLKRKVFFIILSIGLVLPLAVFAQSSGVKGRVRNVDSKSIPNVEVTARVDGKVVRSTRSDRQGRFTLALEPGTYNIAFDAKGYGTGVKYDVKVKENDFRDLGSNLLMTRDRGSLVLIKGIVFDKANLSVRQAPVDLYEIRSDGTTRKLQTVYTNAAGEFEFNGIMNVPNVRVTASANGVSASNDLVTDSPQVYRTVIKLPIEHE